MLASRDPRAGTDEAYRVEHRVGAAATVLAHGVVPLAPLVAELEAQGAGGEVVLVEAATGRVRIRTPVAPVGERDADASGGRRDVTGGQRRGGGLPPTAATR